MSRFGNAAEGVPYGRSERPLPEKRESGDESAHSK
jgi:hypothetical protein